MGENTSFEQGARRSISGDNGAGHGREELGAVLSGDDIPTEFKGRTGFQAMVMLMGRWRSGGPARLK